MKMVFLIAKKWILMKKPKSNEVGTEIECPACDGTGFPKVRQPVQPGRKIFPAPCKQCFGKGRLART
jgi:DnaJ-class molecular chaperone